MNDKEVCHSDDGVECRHLSRVRRGENVLCGKEYFRLAMIDDIVNLVGLKVVEYGYHDGSISNNSHKCYAPSGTIGTAKRNTVATLDASLLEQGVELCDMLCDIGIVEQLTMIVGNGGQVPMVDNGFLDL